MTSKHTPGPWIAAARPSSVVGWPVVAPRATGRSICNITTGHDEAAGNALLISAAPDLLAAVNEAPIPSKYHGERGFEVDRFLADYAVFSALARSAVAKARGGAAV